MAAGTWYLTATTSGSWRTIDEATQAAATNADGWTVGTGNTNSSEYFVGVERATTTFTANTVPDGSLDTTNKDAFRTTTTYTGDFASANWTLNFVGRPVGSATGHQGAMVIRLFRSANADGTGATEITSAQQTGTTCAAMSSTATDYTSTVTFNPGAFSVSNEYIFIQLAWKRITAASMTAADFNFRTGSSSTVGTRIVSSTFTAVSTGTASVTEAADTTSATGSSPITGTSSVTEAADTVTTDGDAIATGTASVTEVADTTSADGTVSTPVATGDANITEAADTTTADSTHEVVGDATPTEAADTTTATSTHEVVGDASPTESADTTAADGTVANAAAIGDANITEAADTTTATASVAVAGDANIVESADTASATANSLAVGTAELTEVADTVSATAASPVVGTASITESADTTAATGSQGAILGTASVTEVADTTTADGTVSTGPTISGDLSVTEAADTATGAGLAVIGGTANITEGADTSTADATAPITGTGTFVEAGDTLTALGEGLILGLGLLNEALDTLTADGTIPLAGVTGDANITEAADTLIGFSGMTLVFTDTGVYVLLQDRSEVRLRTDDEPVAVFTRPDEMFVRFPRSNS